MRLFDKQDKLTITQLLRLGKNAVLKVVNSDGTESTISLAELAALDSIGAADLAKIDGITNGTAAAGKALVLDSSLDITGIRHLTQTGTHTTGAIAGGDSSLAIDGQAAAQGGEVVVKGGTSSTGGNAGGEAKLQGGTPGATGVGGAAKVVGAVGGATSGKGGAAEVTGGAATANNDGGGAVILTPGAKHGTGLDGGVFNRGTFQFRKMPAPQTATNTASLTDAQMTGGLIVATPTAAATYTVRTGTQLKAALPSDLAADDSFDLTIINIGATTFDITLAAAADITIVGDAVVRPSADSPTEQAGQGTFRFRYTTGVTFIAYRIS